MAEAAARRGRPGAARAIASDLLALAGIGENRSLDDEAERGATAWSGSAGNGRGVA
jgi:hypothetical protein